MSLHHYSALKVATWVFGFCAAMIVALDPTVKVALIVAIPSAITGIGTLVLGFMNRGKLSHLSVDLDGKLSKLIETREELSHAQGRREGIEVTQDREANHAEKEES